MATLILLLGTMLAITSMLLDRSGSARLVNDSEKLIATAQDLLSAEKDAETGQRGYLLTGDPVYLTPFTSGAERVYADLSALRELVAQNPDQTASVARIAALSRAKLAELDRTVALRQAGEQSAALDLVRTGEGKAAMDELRSSIGSVVDRENQLLKHRQSQLETEKRRAIVGAELASVATIFAALFAAYFLLLRDKKAESIIALTATELSNRMAQLRAIYDRAPVGLAFVDRSLRYRAINERMATMNGVKIADHLDHTIAEALPEIAACVEPIYRRVLETGEPVLGVDSRTRRPTQSMPSREYMGDYWPVRDGIGDLIGVGAVFVDVTERNAAMAALAASEAHIKTIYDTVPVGLVLAELPSGRIVGGNAYVERITGHPVLLSPDLDSHGEWASYHADGSRVRGEEYPIARIARAGEEAPEIEVLYDRAGKRAWTRIMGRPVRDSRGAVVGAVVALVDIDKEKRAGEALEAEVAARTAELRTAVQSLAEVNAQLDAFVYTISHDLRAPLRAMEGFARILLDDHARALGPIGGDYAERIVNAAARMENLIDALLAYSRLGRTEVALQPVDLNALMARCIEEARADSIDPVEAQVTVTGTMPAVLAEPVVLRQILFNLLSNALKFRHPGAASHIRVTAEPQSDRVRLWVEDNGIGIAPEHQSRIFDVFERLHGQETYPGTGIGLAIVRKGLEHMGGRCGVISSPERGSRFWIELAAAPDGPEGRRM